MNYQTSNNQHKVKELMTQDEVNGLLYKQFQDLSEHFLNSVLQDHLNIFHRLLHDDLSISDLIQSMDKYGVDLEKRYYDLLSSLPDDEIEDDVC